jgi:serine protease inhibitor
MKTKGRRAYLAGVIILLLMGGTGVLLNYFNQGLAYAESDAKAQTVDSSVVNANTGFAIKLLKELAIEQKAKNIFISPLSVSIALAMTYNGANTSTREAMAKTLGLEGMSTKEVNTGYQQLLGSLENADDQVSVTIGNSVWIRESFASGVKQVFTDALKQSYHSEVYSRTFDPSTVNEVNSWVEKETNGKINKILDKIEPENVMFLINAIYFKGNWVDKFDERATRLDGFTTSEGKQEQFEMMHNVGKYSYYSDNEVEIARLPYGRDKIAMYVFLPHKGVDLNSYVTNLELNVFENYFAKLSKIELDLQLPKLKLEYGKIDLKNSLTNLGMGVAFDPHRADLSGIADVRPENLYIAFVDHKAVVEVNEKGTEAAAVTNVGISVVSMPLRVSFTVDRPYMFLIRDDRSGSVLFTGLIENPLQKISP